MKIRNKLLILRYVQGSPLSFRIEGLIETAKAREQEPSHHLTEAFTSAVKTCVLLLFLNLASVNALAQTDNVTFSGSVSRPEHSDYNVTVQGTVHIRFAYATSSGSDSDVLVPFTIPSGQTSIRYSKTVPWSLTEIDNGKPPFGYFLLEVSCTTNCSEAGLWPDRPISYGTDGNMILFSSSNAYPRQFGSMYGNEPRSGFYSADLVLLPNDGVLTGGFSLPKGQLAIEDVEIGLIALDYGGGGYDSWYNVFVNQIVIPRGQSSVQFSLTNLGVEKDELFWGNRSRYAPSHTMLGYVCVSSGCKTHDLLPRGWLVGASDKVVSVNRPLSKGMSFAFATNQNNFTVDFPKRTELLRRRTEPVTIKVNRSPEDPNKNQEIVGKILVEKKTVDVQCYYGFGILSLDTKRCIFPWYVESASNEIISTTEFKILAGHDSSNVSVRFDYLYQPTDDTRYTGYFNKDNVLARQYIKFICEKGCERHPYSKSGYFVSNESKFSTRSTHFAREFTSTEQYRKQLFSLSLLNTPNISAILSYLLDDEP